MIPFAHLTERASWKNGIYRCCVSEEYHAGTLCACLRYVLIVTVHVGVASSARDITAHRAVFPLDVAVPIVHDSQRNLGTGAQGLEVTMSAVHRSPCQTNVLGNALTDVITQICTSENAQLSGTLASGCVTLTHVYLVLPCLRLILPTDKILPS